MMMLAMYMKQGSKFTVDLKGFGLSLVDSEPRELIYLSVYKLYFSMEKWTE
jgi:hypothetical protein